MCPSEDHGLNLPRALGGLGVPGEANWTIRGSWCPQDPGSRMGMWNVRDGMEMKEWDGDTGCRGGMEMRDANAEFGL